MEYTLNPDELEEAIVQYVKQRVKQHDRDADFDAKNVRYVRVSFPPPNEAKKGDRRPRAVLVYEEPGSELV